MLPLLLLLPLLILSTTVLRAEIIHVPDDQETIQAAIAAANNGDVVLIEPGHYVENINFGGKLVTVAGRYYDTGDESFIARTIIDGNAAGRVVIFRTRETAEARLIGLTITNGRYGWGGGVYVSGASPTLSRLIIHGNVATSNGGGVYATADSHPVLNNVTIVGNTGQNGPGGLNCYGGSTALMSNSIIWGNEPVALPDALEATYSAIQGGRAGEGNIGDDPLFVDAQGGDYGLTQNSPCIDTGDPNLNPDPDGSRLDMGAVSYTQPAVIEVQPLTVNFGAIHLRQRSDAVVSVISAGAARLNIEAPDILRDDAPFQITSGGDAARINPGDTLTITVMFEPTAAGDFVDTLQILSNDPDDGEINVRLVGTGLPPAPDVAVTPAGLDFGDVVLSQQSDIELAVRNAGDADLVITSIHLENDILGEFSFDDRGEFNVAAGAEERIAVHFLADTLGAATARLRIESNDGDTPQLLVTLFANGILPQARYRYLDNTGVNASVLLLSVTIHDQPLSYGSEMGVFSLAGLCCGGDFWLGRRLGFAAWGDNEMTEAIDGLRDGEAFTFKVWDIVAGQEFTTEIEVVEGDRNYAQNGVSVFRLSVPVVRRGFQVYVTNGWGIISAPVDPAEHDVVRLWQPVVARGHLTMIKDASGRFYIPARGFTNLPPWDFRQGYLVRGSALDSLDLGEDYMAIDTPIPLRSGWSIVAYFPDVPLTAPVAFRNIVNDLNIAKDASGRFYVPSIPFNNMQPLRRGLGYYVRVSRSLDLVWNVQQRAAPSAPPSIGGGELQERELLHFAQPAPTGLSMSVILNGATGISGGEIAAFTPDGLLIGAARLDGDDPWGIALWGDDPTTPAKDGAVDGEAVRFVLWNEERTPPLLPPASGGGVDAGGTPALRATWNGPSVFAGNELASVELSLAKPLPTALRLEPPQPNPFNGRATLTFALPEAGRVWLAIYDLAGRMVGLLADGEQEAGVHRLTWDAAGLPTGVYIARLETDQGLRAAKLTLLR